MSTLSHGGRILTGEICVTSGVLSSIRTHCLVVLIPCPPFQTATQQFAQARDLLTESSVQAEAKARSRQLEEREQPGSQIIGIVSHASLAPCCALPPVPCQSLGLKGETPRGLPLRLLFLALYLLRRQRLSPRGCSCSGVLGSDGLSVSASRQMCRSVHLWL